jgi:hypothetical protein
MPRRIHKEEISTTPAAKLLGDPKRTVWASFDKGLPDSAGTI